MVTKHLLHSSEDFSYYVSCPRDGPASEAYLKAKDK